jgi:UDP-2,3-diacylglucosamine pyrophosphatase LpxH
MDAYRPDLIKLSIIAAASLAIGGCEDDCNGKSGSSNFLTVMLYPDDLLVSYTTRRIILNFNQPIDPLTLKENIFLSDKGESFTDKYIVILDQDDPSGQRVAIDLIDEFSLKESWKYTVTVTDRVRSISCDALPSTEKLSFNTTSRHPFEIVESAEDARTKIVIISDLHMNEQRAYDESYSLFTENGPLLVEFLEQVRTSKQIKELIILGDLMDMWVVPMAYHTYHDGIGDTEAYFHSVAEADVNKEVIDKINQIANEGDIRFIYVPGNHDMLFTKEIFHAIFPNGHWQGSAPGTGAYLPEATVVCEHGHNYDLFNAPDSVTTSGSLLPPGYFITRIYATGNLKSTEKLPIKPQSTENKSAKLIYDTAWAVAVIAINIPNFDLTKPQIYTHIDGYTEQYSSNSARDIYSQDIGENWQKRQKINGVRFPNPEIIGILNGTGKYFWFGTLEYSAAAQYFSPSGSDTNIVVFGHTHDAMLKKDKATHNKIYANSGAWIDRKYLNDNALTATCIVLNTSASSGSDLDNVTLYQAVDQEGKMVLKKIDEKVLDHSKES